MNRRRFLKGALAATALGGRAGGGADHLRAADEKKAAKKSLMKAGHQNRSSDEDLRVLAALGVNHICAELPSKTLDDYWSVKGLTKLRERVEKFGLNLDMVPLPLSSSRIDRAEHPNIMLAKDPERDREIDTICTMIRNVETQGLPVDSLRSSIGRSVTDGAAVGEGYLVIKVIAFMFANVLMSANAWRSFNERQWSANRCRPVPFSYVRQVHARPGS